VLQRAQVTPLGLLEASIFKRKRPYSTILSLPLVLRYVPEYSAIAPMSSSEFLDQPFWLLGVDPAATREHIQAAFEIAKQRSLVTDETLSAAYQILLDPAQRLPHELAYPLGYPITELDEWRRLRLGNVEIGELAKHAAGLSPLSQANFFAFYVADRPADSPLLRAMLGAHGRIEPTNVYNQLKDTRRLGELPPPSLASVNEQLEIQLRDHCQRSIFSHPRVDDAAEAIGECVRQTRLAGDQPQIDALERLLAVYHDATIDLRSARLADVEAACEDTEKALGQQSSIDALAVALDHWAKLSRPLFLHGTNTRVIGERLLARLRSLVIDLALNAEYELAIELADLGKEKLSLIQGSAEMLDKAALPAMQAYRMRRDRKIASLMALIGEHKRNPAQLVEAIKDSGFGPGGIGAAARLWQVFAEAVDATVGGIQAPPEHIPVEPWLEIRSFAKWLRGQPGGVSAAKSILEGLLDQGPQIALPDKAIEMLRDDLRPDEATSTTKHVSARPPATKVRFYVVALMIVLCAASIIFQLTPWHMITNTINAQFAHRLAESFSQKAATLDAETSDEETVPAVGTQRRLSLPSLRYCKFQEERLRLIKTKVRSPEDTRAFNLLAVDYNARCSDFLYRDSDILVVEAELDKNRKRFADEADHILSTWRGQVPSRMP